MIAPIVHGRLYARQCLELTVEEVAERCAGDVDVAAVAVDEIHGHIECVVHVALEPHAVLEGERQHARARRIRIADERNHGFLEQLALTGGDEPQEEPRGREDAVTLMTLHTAKGLEYDAVVLFLDELILWLASHAADLGFGRVFPHPYGSKGSKYYYTLLLASPVADELTVDFAKEIIRNEDLGKDDIPDFLAVGLSSTDP